MKFLRILLAASLTLLLALLPSTASAQSNGTIEGHIFDEATGLPLVDWVAVSAYDDVTGEQVATMSAPTDADGRYQITVPVGTYRLEFFDARLMGYLSEWWQDKPDFAGADPIVVGEGEVAGPFDFNVGRAPDTGGWIAGTVTDEGSNSLWRMNWVVYDTAGNRLASGRTDESGNYRTSSLGTGSFKMAFEDTAIFMYESAWFGGSDFESATVIDVAEGVEVAGINVSLARLSSPVLPVTGGFEVEVLGLALALLGGGFLFLRIARRRVA